MVLAQEDEISWQASTKEWTGLIKQNSFIFFSKRKRQEESYHFKDS